MKDLVFRHGVDTTGNIMQKRPRLALFGASGFLGRALAAAASQQGYAVLCLGRTPMPDYEWQACDLARPDNPVLPEGLAAVFYLAQSPYYRDFPRHAEHLFMVNALGPVRVASAAWQAGCRFFCYASTGNVYAPSFDPLREDAPLNTKAAYALSKRMGEEGLLAFQEYMTVTAVRIFGLYGPGQRAMLPWILAQRILSETPVEIAPGPLHDDEGLRVSFLYRDDAVQRLLALTEMALQGAALPSILNLAGEEPVSIRRFASVLGECLGRTPHFLRSEQKRCMDLWADISLLNELCPFPFTDLHTGMVSFCESL